MSVEVSIAHLNFVKFIEKHFQTKVTALNDTKYFSRAFEIWFKMATGGKSNQVSELISKVDIREENNANIKFKNPIVELIKSAFGMSEHTLPTLVLGLLENLPVNDSKQTRAEFEAELETLRNAFHDLLGEDGVLIFPSFPSIAPFHNEAVLTNPIDWIVYFGYINSIGLPSTQIPLGLTKKDSMPVGVQLVAGRYCDKLTIKLAQALEKEIGGWIEPE